MNTAKKSIYLDYNATAPIRLEVKDSMLAAMDVPANASSVHSFGRAAKKQLEDARAVVAGVVGCFPNEVVFTASGTEANNLALRNFPERPLMVSAVEHPSALKVRPEVKVIPVDENGIININKLTDNLQFIHKPLVSVMMANNETGVIQPIREIAEAVHATGGLLHCDAVQALGKIPVDLGVLGVDMLTLSAHKFGGPVGAAALIVRQDLAIQRQLIGGGQELGRRAGTENIPAIAGFAKAVELAAKDRWQRDIREALDGMEEMILAAVPGAHVLGRQAQRLPNTSSLLMPGVSAETQLMHFDLEGFAVSAGSACSSGRIEPSHVVRAMGFSEEEAACVIRVSAGWDNKPEDIQGFATSWLKLAGRLVKKAA